MADTVPPAHAFPRVDAPIKLNSRTLVWLRLRSGHLLWMLALVFVGLIAHGLNMFNHPAPFGDEGIYMEQAWSVLRQGRLSPYTYWYDHAPAGWFLIAAWLAFTGGPLTFGNSLDSGRILMLLLHLAMIPLLFRITFKLSGSTLAAAVASLLFSLSPLAVFYQRLVLLDNIMLFWLLVSIEWLLDGWGRLSRFVLSGVAFGLAVLTKETAIFLLPAVLFLAWRQRWEHQGRFALVGWTLPMALVVSLYGLFALLKGELLPAGQAISIAFFNIQSEGGVSLTDTLKWQASRSGGGLFNLNNTFWQLARGDWLNRDPLLFLGGTVASLANVVRGIWDRKALVAGLFGVMPVLYLARGGIVFDFYLLFAIPFLCLNLGVLAAPLAQRVPVRFASVAAAVLGLALLAGYLALGKLQPLYTQQQGVAHDEAIHWVKQHLPGESRIVTRDDFWVDLHEPGLGGPVFPDAHSHWKVAADPAIEGGVFHDRWQRVDYLVMPTGMKEELEGSGNTVALEALANSNLVKRWDTDGYSVEIWKVNQAGATASKLLRESYAYIVHQFEREGAYIDSRGGVTSEAQAYAMLRAVWSDDREAFNRAWGWVQANMMGDGGLPYWLWRDGEVVERSTASDADTDMALALLFAGKRWNDADLLDAGRRMVQAVWQREVDTVDGVPYLVAGDWAAGQLRVAINPSYLSPYAYRIFAEVDPDHDWRAVVDSSYRVLFDASKSTLGAERSAGLPPDWVGLDRETGEPVPLELPRGDTTVYGYDAARAYWRVALDLRWTGDGRAKSYLEQAGFLRDEVARNGNVRSVYTHNGEIVEEHSSVVSTAGAMSALLTLDPNGAHRLYAGQIVGGSVRTESGLAWTNTDDLFAQAWGWFATALYADALPDLWHEP